MNIADTSVATIYTVPAADWQAIKQRVSWVLAAENQWYTGIINANVPQFPNLVAACQQWQAGTFPSLARQGQQLADYADHAGQTFHPLAVTVAALDPNATLPPALASQLQAALADLNQRTATIRQSCQALVPELNTFYLVNGLVDQEILSLESQYNLSIPAVAQELQTMSNATGQLLGDWSAIANNLQQVATGQVELTLAILSSMDLQAALSAWQTIESQAKGFLQNSAG